MQESFDPKLYAKRYPSKITQENDTQESIVKHNSRNNSAEKIDDSLEYPPTMRQPLTEKKKKGKLHRELNETEAKLYLNYEPHRPELLTWDDLKLSENFAVKDYSKSVYRGNIVDSQRHGKGVIVYETGRVYEGEWSDDKRNGQGFEIFGN